MKKQLPKKGIALLLCLTMLFGLIPGVIPGVIAASSATNEPILLPFFVGTSKSNATTPYEIVFSDPADGIYASSNPDKLPIGSVPATGGDVLYLETNPMDIGDSVTVNKITGIPYGNYKVELLYKEGSARATVQCYLDGVAIADPIDMVLKTGSASYAYVGSFIYTQTLTENILISGNKTTEHSFKMEVVEKTGTNMSFGLRLTPVGDPFVTLDTEHAQLDLVDQQPLTVTATVADGFGEITWVCDDPSVATVTAGAGNSAAINAVSVGETTVTATVTKADDPLAKSSVQLPVTVIDAPGVVLNTAKVAVSLSGANHTAQVTAEVDPRFSDLKWSSSDTKIATVAGSGSVATITGVSEGVTTITATVQKGTLHKTAQLTVRVVEGGVDLTAGTLKVQGDLAVDIDPTAIRFNNLEWSGLNITADVNTGRQSQVYEVNRVTPHATLMPYETLDKAVTGAQDYDREQSKYYMSLTTEEDIDPLSSDWQFAIVDSLTYDLDVANAKQDPWNEDQNIVDFYKTDYDASNWPGVAVPSDWQVQGINADGEPYTGYYDPEYGYDPPFYTNIAMPGSVVIDGVSRKIFNDVAIPAAPQDYNPVGFYRTTFDVPEQWIKEKNKVFISFAGVEAAFYVYVNGMEVGYHEDSKSPGEFDLTPFLNADGKDNLLAVKVYRWADSSWMDDQDFIRLGGIFREVYLMATPALHIQDYKVETDFDTDFQDATLKLNVQINNYTADMDLENYAVVAQVFDKSGRDLLLGNNILLPLGNIKAGDTVNVSGQVEVANPHKWFPDDPYLYTLVLSLYNTEDNTAIEYISQQLGFREITYRQEDNDDELDIIRINGQKILMMGANIHSTTPDGGHYVSRETLETDLQIMKQNNLNAIRTSHYPPDTYLLYLADRYGLMVVLEANNESHANTGSSISENNFYALANSRVQNIVREEKNRTSVVMWSLGNESGAQANWANIIENIHTVDHTRPVHYEAIRDTNAGINRSPDVRSSMYTSPSGHLNDCLTNTMAPSIYLCEFNHASGNALGALKDYTDVFRSQARSMGGCIWDYVDQSIWTKPATYGTYCEEGPYAMEGTTSTKSDDVLFSEVKGYGQTLAPGSYITYANTAGTNGQDIFNEKISGTQPFSVEVWARPNAHTGNHVLVAKGDKHFSLKTKDGSALQFSLYTNNGWVSAKANIPADYENGEMHHIVGTFDGSVAKLYYDGKALATYTFAAGTSILTSSTAFAVGNDLENSNRETLADIAGVRVYTRALTAAEIADERRSPADNCPANSTDVIFWANYNNGKIVEKTPEFLDVYGNGMYLGYGGDWGEGNNDGLGCAEGVITALRKAQPELANAKKLFQHLNFVATDEELLDGTVNVRNEFYATNGNQFQYEWFLYENGTLIGSGTLEDLPNMPAAGNGMDVFADLPTVAVNIPYELPDTLRPGAEYFLNIQASLTEATDWADAGHVVAEEQFALPVDQIEVSKTFIADEVTVNDTDDLLVLSGETFSVEFSKADGILRNYIVGDELLLKEGPTPEFTRKDKRGDGNDVKNSVWNGIESKLSQPTIAVEQNNWSSCVTVTVLYGTTVSDNTFITMTYKVYGNGVIASTIDLVTDIEASTSENGMYRFGVDLVMPAGYEQIDWLTRGPEDNFVDRLSGTFVGQYSTTVTDNYYLFINPESTGDHQETRWMALRDEGKSTGLMFVATDGEMGVNALHLDHTDFNVRHPYMLDLREETIISLSGETRGVGGAQAGVQNHYKVQSGNKSFSYTLVPFDAATATAELQSVADPYRNSASIADEPGAPVEDLLMGDVDFSKTVNVADIMKLKALIMADHWSDEELKVGDMDASGKLDVGDIMAVKNIIMSN